MELIISLALFFPVYVGVKYAIRLPKELTNIGLHGLVAIGMTSLIFVALLWLKDGRSAKKRRRM